MSEPLENAYFIWLCAKIVDVRQEDPSMTYVNLLRLIHKTEFVWLLSGDDNRAEDGRVLRDEFLAASGLDPEDSWLSQSCSVLEMLIAFSRKASFETEDPPEHWFWEMLRNLRLSHLNDAVDPDPNEVSNILDTFVWRTYDHVGHGGIFPLRESEYDQRYVEIWYQFSEYLYQNNIM